MYYIICLFCFCFFHQGTLSRRNCRKNFGGSSYDWTLKVLGMNPPTPHGARSVKYAIRPSWTYSICCCECGEFSTIGVQKAKGYEDENFRERWGSIELNQNTIFMHAGCQRGMSQEQLKGIEFELPGNDEGDNQLTKRWSAQATSNTQKGTSAIS